MTNQTISRTLVAVGLTLTAGLLFAATTLGAVSSKFVFDRSFGREVNLTEVQKTGGPEREDICTAASNNECQPGKESSISGGFTFPESVAVGPASSGDDVYVADKVNGRVQVFSPTGVFIRMFGWEVDETKSNAHAPQAERDVCTAASHDICRAGQEIGGGPPEQIAQPLSITVDQTTGDVFVHDFVNNRVDKYTPEGKLLWMIGEHVNKNGTNLCLAGEECQAGLQSPPGSTAHGAFKPEEFLGNLLTVQSGKLYVGDEARVQQFEASTGVWTNNVSLASLGQEGHVAALGVDGSGNLYVAYRDATRKTVGGVHVLSPSGEQLQEIDPDPRAPIVGLALDPFGRIAVTHDVPTGNRGRLFDVSSGKKLAEFATGFGLAFTQDPEESKDELYAANPTGQEIEKYVPVPVAVPVTTPCKSQTATSITMTGEVNPENVPETTAWFQYATSETLGLSSEHKNLAGGLFIRLENTLTELLPDQTYYYRTVAEDANYHPLNGEEPLAGEIMLCATSYLPPLIEGEHAAYYITYSSAALSAQLNPENAHTTYRFQYGACPNLEACPTITETPSLESSAYGTIRIMQSATGLQPASEYHYRLVAESEGLGKTKSGPVHGPEGQFITAPAPKPSATTGPAGALTSSSAVLTGTANPGGAPATYTLQIGLYNSASTVYGTVTTGPLRAEANETPISFLLTGLQAGTAYAYRITTSNTYGTSIGEPTTFTTLGIPTTINEPTPPTTLPTPHITFPKTNKTNHNKTKKKKTTKKTTHTNRHQKKHH